MGNRLGGRWDVPVGGLACVMLASLLFSSTASAETQIPEGTPISVQYKGTMTMSSDAPPLSGSVAEDHHQATFEWDEHMSYVVGSEESFTWNGSTLSGTVSDTGRESDGSARSCSAEIVPEPGRGEHAGLGIYFPEEGDEEPTGHHWEVGGGEGAPLFLAEDQLTHSEGNDGAIWCEDGWVGSNVLPSVWNFAPENDGDFPGWEAAADPKVYFPEMGSYTQPVDYENVCRPPTCGPEYEGSTPEGEVSVKIVSAITFSAGTEPISPESPGPILKPPEARPPAAGPEPEDEDKRELKEEAFKEVQRAGLRTAIACGTEVGNAVGEGLEVLAAPTEVGELALAGVMPLAKAALSGYLNSEGLSFTAQCHEAAEELKHALERYVNDPPDHAYHQVALPLAKRQPTAKQPSGACAKAQGAKAANCTRLQDAVDALAAARKADAPIEAALATASNRLATAHAAGDTGGVALQEATSEALMGELAAGFTKENAAQRALAGLLSSYKLRISIKPSADATGIAAAEREAGPFSSALHSVAGSELSARKLSFSDLLKETADTSIATTLWHSITFQGLGAILQSLKAGGQIPTAQATKLASALGAAEVSGGANRSAKLMAFATSAQALHSSAGTLLRYGAEGLG